MWQLTSTQTAAGIFTKIVAASDAVEIFDIRVHISAAAKRRSRQSGGPCDVECLARLPGRLLLSRRGDGGGRLLRGVFVFALLCAEWRRGGRVCCLRYYDGRRN